MTGAPGFVSEAGGAGGGGTGKVGAMGGGNARIPAALGRSIGGIPATPLGATGLAQCTELVQQLRGQSGDRQVEGAKVALQHNLGLGGAVVTTIYMRA